MVIKEIFDKTNSVIKLAFLTIYLNKLNNFAEK